MISMTVARFREMIDQMAYERMGLFEFCDFLRHNTHEDKWLREEYLPLLAVVRHKKIADCVQIELGQNTQPWDARIGGHDLYEVVQALPEREHEVREAIAGDGQSWDTWMAHRDDALQFPGVIVEAIKKKHAKGYADHRSLVVVFGDYTGENDAVIHRWMSSVRRQTTRGAFKEILLVELDRRKVFVLFPPAARSDADPAPPALHQKRSA